MIQIRNVSFSYPGADAGQWAVRDVDLEIGDHEFIAFLGPNGSGKSSLSRLLNGIELPTRGAVLVDGLDTADEGAIPAIRRKVQIVFQNPENQQVGITVGEDVAFGLSNMGWPQAEMAGRIRWALETAGLEVDEDRLVNELSGGEKQKLALASVLALGPRYLILDESTSMLDPQARAQFVQSLETARRRHPFAVIYVTHHLEEALKADRWALFAEGRLLALGKPDDLWIREGLMEQCGLELPYLHRVWLSLKERGLPVPLSIQEWEERLCKSS